ncbi:peptidylprolyl isomerase [Tenuifilaceae bacterium CYCD]|nr:peptidylprolyl isomerase [Tenuifilaceae bacterium CYCD]
MATLERIRNRAGVLVAVVIGLALFAFILGDLINSGGSLFNRAQMEVAEIAGTSIPYEQYQAKIDENENLQKLFSQQAALDEQSQIQIRERVWQDLLRTNIMQPEYEKLGLEIHEDELMDMVQGQNIHPIIQQQFGDPQTGQVNKEYINMLLKNLDNDPRARAYWMYIEQEVIKDRLFTKYLNLIRKGLYVTSLQTKRSFADRTNKVDFDYAVARYSSVSDSTIKVSSSDLKDYYNAHKNDYKQQASRDVEYVVFPIKASDEDTKAAGEWINKTKDEFVASAEPKQFVNLKSDTPFDAKYHKESELPAEFGSWALNTSVGDVKGPVFDGNSYKVARLVDVKMMPDSVKARHILVSPKGQSQQDYNNAKSQADSLLSILKRGGNWNDIASRFSNDPGSKDKGGDLGWFPSGVMEQSFDEACFSNKKGEINVVETRYGFHIIEVTERGKESKKAQVAILERKVVPSSHTTQLIYAKAAEFAGMNKTHDKFVAAANAQKLTTRYANNLLQNDRNIAGLESPREMIRWAFKNEKGTVSTVFEFGDLYVVGVITNIREEGIAPLKQVSDDVKVKVIREKKAEILSKKVKDAMKSGNIADVARSLNSTVERAEKVSFSSYTLPSAGIEPAVIGTATTVAEGKLSGPIKGNAGVYVLAVTASTKEDGDLNSEKFRLSNMYQSRAYYEAFEALKTNANISDKRYNFY